VIVPRKEDTLRFEGLQPQRSATREEGDITTPAHRAGGRQRSSVDRHNGNINTVVTDYGS